MTATVSSTEPQVQEVMHALQGLAQESGWLGDLRQRALQSFAQQGLPSTRWEGWRHTSLRPLAEHPLVPAPAPTTLPSPAQLRDGGLRLDSACELVIVDGRYAPELSAAQLPQGVSVTALSKAAEGERALLEEHLASHLDYDEESLAALNTAFLQDGLLVQVARGTVVEQPLHLRIVATPGKNRTVHPRVLVVVAENSELTLVESYGAVPEARLDAYVCNTVTELSLASAARVRHLRYQDEGGQSFHFGTLHVRQGKDSTLRSYHLSVGARLSRVAATARLEAPGATCEITGLGVVTNKHLDNYSVIHHVAPHCQSHVVFKNVLDGKSSTAFNAKMVVHAGAVQSSGDQQNRNLLLSKQAVANTRPQLEIYNNDVKAAHGATVGQLDPDQLFYLRARGISEDDARRELTLGFAREILDAMPFPALREQLEERVRQQLR